MATNKLHTCKYCDKSFSKKCIGKHIIQEHPDELKDHFSVYRTTAGIAFPYPGKHGYTICLCCGGYWAKTSDGKGCVGLVRNHLNKASGCTEASMLSAIYLLLECDPPANIVSKTTATHYENRLKAKDDSLSTLIRSSEREREKAGEIRKEAEQLKIEHLSFQQKIKSLERQLESERKTRQLWELKFRGLETQRSAEKSLYEEKLQAFTLLCQENSIDDWRIDEINSMIQDSTTELQLKVVEQHLDHYKKPATWLVSEAEAPAPVATPQPKNQPTNCCAHCPAPGEPANLYVCKSCNRTGHKLYQGMYDGCLIDCYNYECVQCKAGVCLDCIKKNGRNGKRFPEYCSTECRTIHEKSKE